jgi:hypothetical protein
MRQRILRLGGGKPRRRVLLATMALAAALGAFLISNALAVHDLGLFELDRNALQEGAPGDDWETLFNADTEPPLGGEGLAGSELFTGILPDSDADAPTEQFTGGGSKDDLDVTSWRWKSGEPLDKDQITNAYAAGYINQTDTGGNDIGDFIVYFGLDRFDASGSAQVGFWFFQDRITQTNVRQGPGNLFGGVHVPGDILVQSNFTNGGVVENVSVYEWVGSGGSEGSLDLLFDGQDCLDAAQPDDPACAAVNRGNTNSPWPYTPKSGPDDVFPQGAFFEGGVNITRLLEATGETPSCFSSFLAETRSSTPFNAELKDFALGEFNTCRVEVDTNATPTGGNVVPGTSVTDTAIVTGESLIGGTAETPTGKVKFFLCQPSEVTAGGCEGSAGTQVGTPPEGEDLTETVTGTSQATSDATSNTTAIGTYCWRAEYVPAAGSPYRAASFTNATDECFTTVAQPTTTTTRQFVYPQDKAKIVATSGGNLTGSVKFELFDSLADCQAVTDVKYTETFTITNEAAPQVRTTTNYPPDANAYAITDGTTHYWKVSYDSENPSQLDSVSGCGTETTAVVFAGDPGNDASIPVP